MYDVQAYLFLSEAIFLFPTRSMDWEEDGQRTDRTDLRLLLSSPTRRIVLMASGLGCCRVPFSLT